jgi:hypothetical protein
LRAEWGELDNPGRIEALTKRYLQLKPTAPTQFGSFEQLPDHPPQFLMPGVADPIGVMIENLEEPETVTGSVPAPDAAGEAGEGEAGAPAAATPDQ